MEGLGREREADGDQEGQREEEQEREQEGEEMLLEKSGVEDVSEERVIEEEVEEQRNEQEEQEKSGVATDGQENEPDEDGEGFGNPEEEEQPLDGDSWDISFNRSLEGLVHSFEEQVMEGGPEEERDIGGVDMEAEINNFHNDANLANIEDNELWNADLAPRGENRIPVAQYVNILPEFQYIYHEADYFDAEGETSSNSPASASKCMDCTCDSLKDQQTPTRKRKCEETEDAPLPKCSRLENVEELGPKNAEPGKSFIATRSGVAIDMDAAAVAQDDPHSALSTTSHRSSRDRRSFASSSTKRNSSRSRSPHRSEDRLSSSSSSWSPIRRPRHDPSRRDSSPSPFDLPLPDDTSSWSSERSSPSPTPLATARSISPLTARSVSPITARCLIPDPIRPDHHKNLIVLMIQRIEAEFANVGAPGSRGCQTLDAVIGLNRQMTALKRLQKELDGYVVKGRRQKARNELEEEVEKTIGRAERAVNALVESLM